MAFGLFTGANQQNFTGEIHTHTHTHTHTQTGYTKFKTKGPSKVNINLSNEQVVNVGQ